MTTLPGETGAGGAPASSAGDGGPLAVHVRGLVKAYSGVRAVNGIEDTLRALGKGQVRTLLADGHDDDARIDDAVEDAFRQRAQVDVLYDEKARRAVDGLAALLRFRR